MNLFIIIIRNKEIYLDFISSFSRWKSINFKIYQSVDILKASWTTKSYFIELFSWYTFKKILEKNLVSKISKI